MTDINAKIQKKDLSGSFVGWCGVHEGGALLMRERTSISREQSFCALTSFPSGSSL